MKTTVFAYVLFGSLVAMGCRAPQVGTDEFPQFSHANLTQNQNSIAYESSVIPASLSQQTADFDSGNSKAAEQVQPDPTSTVGKEAMTLADFQILAIENNPTIGGMMSLIQKTAGLRNQVGLSPNPTIGYQAMQLADQGTDQHTLFIERQFVRGAKLELNRRVLQEAVLSQQFELDTQQLRVLTDVEVKFLEVLAAQSRLELIREFTTVVERALQLSESRFTAQEGSKVDLLQARIQKNEIALSLQQAEIKLETEWKELVANSGVPQLPRLMVSGELPDQAEPIDWNSLAVELVSSSPEMQAARTKISQALALVQRQKAQIVPNLSTQLAAGVDNGTDSGMINLQVGMPLQLNNRNQGNISAAHADYCRALREAERVELSITARLASIEREYDSALAAVLQFKQEILPSALESLNLAEESYRAGESSFVQVLLARETFFKTKSSFLTAQVQLAQAIAKLQGATLTGALESRPDEIGNDGLRGQALDQQ